MNWCIVTIIKKLFLNLVKILRNPLALGKYCSVFHLAVTSFFESNTTRYTISLYLKNTFIFFFLNDYDFMDSCRCILIFKDLNFILRLCRYIVAIQPSLISYHDIIHIKRFSLIKTFSVSLGITSQVESSGIQ